MLRRCRPDRLSAEASATFSPSDSSCPPAGSTAAQVLRVRLFPALGLGTWFWLRRSPGCAAEHPLGVLPVTPVPGRPTASQVVVQMPCDSGCPGQTADGCLAGGSRPHRVAGVGGKGDLASGPDRLASRR